MDSCINSNELQHTGAEHSHDEEGNKMFGLIVFLMSESGRSESPHELILSAEFFFKWKLSV